MEGNERKGKEKKREGKGKGACEKNSKKYNVEFLLEPNVNSGCSHTTLLRVC
jgi:hypothetical protein